MVGYVSEEMIRLFYKGFTVSEITSLEKSLERILNNLVEVTANDR